jgi:hypothetical protein
MAELMQADKAKEKKLARLAEQIKAAHARVEAAMRRTLKDAKQRTRSSAAASQRGSSNVGSTTARRAFTCSYTVAGLSSMKVAALPL